MPVTTTSLTLIRSLGSRDRESWERLVKIYEPFIRRLVILTGLNLHDREDLVQDVMLALVKSVPEFRHSGQKGAFRTWLRTIVRNRLLGFRRRKATVKETVQKLDSTLLDFEDPASDIRLSWEEQHNRYVIARMLELLESDFTVTTWLAFKRQSVDGCTAQQAAGELGLSINAVLIAKSRVLRRLRQQAEGIVD